jgi:hypothetical protein
MNTLGKGYRCCGYTTSLDWGILLNLYGFEPCAVLEPVDSIAHETETIKMENSMKSFMGKGHCLGRHNVWGIRQPFRIQMLAVPASRENLKPRSCTFYRETTQ